jgi:AraC-like DNA-binding protein
LPYLSAYYFTDIHSPDGAIVDWLNPEWAGVRFRYSGEMIGGFYPEPMLPIPPAHFLGPTSLASPFSSSMSRVASIGFLPVGYCMFIKEPASNWADRIGPVEAVNSPARFMDYWDEIRAAADPEKIAKIFDRMLLGALDSDRLIDADQEARIRAAHLALIDPETKTVVQFAERLGCSIAQLQRMSAKIFGFSPKLLLRRQRFLRTLAVVMRDRNSNWTDALDRDYHDQAHFNRDFRLFFGMNPRAYLAQQHPVIDAAAQARMAFLGDPLQGLQRPGG